MKLHNACIDERLAAGGGLLSGREPTDYYGTYATAYGAAFSAARPVADMRLHAASGHPSSPAASWADDARRVLPRVPGCPIRDRTGGRKRRGGGERRRSRRVMAGGNETVRVRVRVGDICVSAAHVLSAVSLTQ